jgi:hypothetical protein
MKTFVALTVAAAGSLAPAGGVTLHFDADRESVVSGETVRWTVSASFTGYPDPTAYLGGFLGDLLANDPALGEAANPTGLLSVDTGANEPSGASIIGVAVNNLALLGTDDPANPIPVFAFDTLVTSLTGGELEFGASGRLAVHQDNGDFTEPDYYFDVAVTSDRVAIDGPGEPTIRLSARPSETEATAGEPVEWTVSLHATGWSDPGAWVRSVEGSLLASDPGIGSITQITPLNGAEFTGSPDGPGIPVFRLDADPEGDAWPFGETIDVLRFTLEPAFPGSVGYTVSGDAMANAQPLLGPIPVPVESASETARIRYSFLADRLIRRVNPIQSRANDLFGNEIAIDGDRMIVAATGTDTSTGEGVAYVYSTSGHRFSTLTPGDPESHFFGSSVAIEGSTVAVGTVGYASISSIPKAFVYDITDPESPVQTCQIIAEGDTARQEFGLSIDLGDGVLAVGAPDGHRSEFAGATAGSVYLFDLSCTPIAQITPPNGEPRDFFADSFGIEGDLLLAGAWGAGAIIPGSGASGRAYLYDISDPAAPALLHTFERPDGVAWGFGYSVAIADGWCAIASRGGSSVVFYDLTDPAMPTQSGIATLGVDSLIRVAMDGDLAAVRFETNEVDLYRRGGPSGPELIERVAMHETMDPQTVRSGLAIDGDLGAFGMAYDSTVDRFVGSFQLFYPGEPYACTGADLAEPLGQHDLADLVAFASAFVAGDPIADLSGDGLFDVADITAFVGAFTAGCP